MRRVSVFLRDEGGRVYTFALFPASAPPLSAFSGASVARTFLDSSAVASGRDAEA